jgi:hypothetical protein
MYNLCRHVMPSGKRCDSPALRNRPCCYFHSNLRRSAAPKGRYDDWSIKIPPLEDSRAVQIALTEVLSALAAARIDPQRARLLLYGLQIAAQVTARPSQPTTECVRDLPPENEDEALAPEKSQCEPPRDCPACPARDRCRNLTRILSVGIKQLLPNIGDKQAKFDQPDTNTLTDNHRDGS